MPPRRGARNAPCPRARWARCAHPTRDEIPMTKLTLGVTAAFILFAAPTVAAPCGGAFETWLASFRREAAQQGISPRALAALDGVTPNPQVISLDRQQGVFRQSFEQFSGHRIAERLPHGA